MMAVKRLEKLFEGCFLLAAALILVQNGFLLALAAAFGIWKAAQRPLPYFTALLFCGTLAGALLLILQLHPPLTSDFETLFRAARDLLAHDFSWQESAYFSLWAYQVPFVLWEAFWLSLWDSPVCLELAGAVCAAGTACLLYRLSRQWVSECAAQAASVLLAVFPFFATFHTLPSNQVPSAFFMTLALWLLACGDCGRLGFLRFPLAGLSLQAGNLLRSEGILLVAALLAWGVFRLAAHRGEFRRLGAGALAFLAVYCGVQAGAAACLRESGLSPGGLRNGNPLWKFVTGLSYEAQGGYSEEDWGRIAATLDEHNQPTAETDALQKRMIAGRLAAGPSILVRHVRNKLRCQWVADGLSWVFAGFSMQHPFLYGLLREYDRGIFFLALALSAYGISDKTRWKRRPQAARLPYFVFFAAFCAFLLVEVQPRYAYLPQLYVFMGAAFGIDRLREGKNHAEDIDHCTLPERGGEPSAVLPGDLAGCRGDGAGRV